MVVLKLDEVPLGCRCVGLPHLTQLWVRILGHPFLILATYLLHRLTKKFVCCLGPISGCLGALMGSP